MYWVSDKLREVSKNNDDEQHIQESAEGGSFSEQKDTEMVYGKVKRGRSFAYWKEDESEFLEERRLKDVAKKHSEFIGSPSTCTLRSQQVKEVN